MVNLEQLKEQWSFTGIDVEDLIKRIRDLLTEYHHTNTEQGVIQWLSIFMQNKKHLVEMIMKSPNYNGNLQIVLKESFDRDIDANKIYSFIGHFPSRIKAQEKIITDTEENYSESEKELINDMPGKFRLTQLDNSITNIQSFRKRFTYDGKNREKVKQYDNFRNIIEYFRYYSISSVNDSLKNCIENIEPELKIGVGMKTSRAFNKVCTYYGLTNCSEYNTLFPQYADLINVLTRELHYVISLNPIDYLKMSFGNTWASCHTIDKENVRGKENAYRGDYCGGTISYMLDSVSFINYVVPVTDGKHPEELDKIYRNMFHYDCGALVQGRVYPQGKDGATDLYEKLRNIMQRELSSILGYENLWIKKGSTHGEDWIKTVGVHYPDYSHFEYCNLSIIKELKDTITVDEHFMSVGHKPVCAACGEETDDMYSNYLICENCK